VRPGVRPRDREPAFSIASVIMGRFRRSSAQRARTETNSGARIGCALETNGPRPRGAAVIRRRVVVRGDVQGVGFRVSAARAAESRGVSGWVRNRLDGSVEAVFEGEPDAVEGMVRWCERGPRGAEVDAVEVFAEQREGEVGFTIRGS